VVTTHGEPQAAIVDFETFEAVRGAVTHLLLAEMEASFTRTQEAVHPQSESVVRTGEDENSSAELCIGCDRKEERRATKRKRRRASDAQDELRVAVGVQIALAMFLVRRDQPNVRSPKRELLRLLPSERFRWLWTPDILADYEFGATTLTIGAIAAPAPWFRVYNGSRYREGHYDD